MNDVFLTINIILFYSFLSENVWDIQVFQKQELFKIEYFLSLKSAHLQIIKFDWVLVDDFGCYFYCVCQSICPICKMYLFDNWNVCVWRVKCICLKFEVYFQRSEMPSSEAWALAAFSIVFVKISKCSFLLQNLYVKNLKCICLRCEIYLSKCEILCFENKYGWAGASGGPWRLSLLCQTNVKSIAGKTSKYWKKKEIENSFCLPV